MLFIVFDVVRYPVLRRTTPLTLSQVSRRRGRAWLPGARAPDGAAVPLPELGARARAAGRRLHGGDPHETLKIFNVEKIKR